MIRRVALAFALAFVVTAFVAVPVFATTYYVSEYSGSFSGTNLTSLNPCAGGWTCADSNAKRAYLYAADPSTYNASGVWVPQGAGSELRRIDWWAYIPSDGGAANFAAVKNYFGIYNVTVNQTNWKGSYVYLGYNTGNNNTTLWMTNQCVSGFLCNSSLPVFYDKIQFTY